MPEPKEQTQRALFDEPAPEPAEPAEQAMVHLDAVPRLSRQCQDILWRLRQSPALNSQLVQRAICFRARITELRGKGCRIVANRKDLGQGLVEYTLEYEHPLIRRYYAGLEEGHPIPPPAKTRKGGDHA